MDVARKEEFFHLLCGVGFKEIEIGFPSASQIEYDFTRRLIEGNLIPEGTAVQVLTQAREELIRRTAESLKGAPRAVIHLYNSTSVLQRKITFNKNKDEIKAIAIQGARAVKKQLKNLKGTEVLLEYSPESFTGTEPDYALEVCRAVADVWEPDEKNPMILNLPATVELFSPNVYADMIEWFIRNLKDRKSFIVSVHTHNDRGTGTAATELALMAGADRVEGTLFGNGERTGNLDIMMLGLNMFSQGVDPGLDLYDVPRLRSVYEKLTGMKVDDRYPYAGDLVFTAFSGSHQDAIKKGLDRQKESPEALWEVPYLPINPKDIGRSYEAVIRINSQSGKGGVSYILSREFGLKLPKPLSAALGQKVTEVSDRLVRELTPKEIYGILEKEFLNIKTPAELSSYRLRSEEGKTGITAELRWAESSAFSADGGKNGAGEARAHEGEGDGSVSAFFDVLQKVTRRIRPELSFTLEHYNEQAVGQGAGTEAVAYIMLKAEIGGGSPNSLATWDAWGAGRHTDITRAAIYALLSAYNALFRRSGE